MRKQLDTLLAKADLHITEDQKNKLIQLVELLNKWNKAYNLTSVRDPKDMLVKHILDSLVVSPYLDADKLIDVGTGPGLPGLPLAIVNPDKHFTLLDSLGKRIRFITQVIHELGIQNVTPVQSRVEDFNIDGGFDIVLSRAFASIDDMVTWCKHLPKEETGRFFALKGQYPTQELQELPDWCEVEDIINLTVPNLEGERHLVKIKKKG